jgi:hypothetical protein
MLLSKKRKINIKKRRSFKRIKNGGDILLLSNDNPLYVVYIYYEEKYWPIFISLHNIVEHDNYYEYRSLCISRYLRELNNEYIMEETIFGNYIKDNTYLAEIKINVKDNDKIKVNGNFLFKDKKNVKVDEKITILEHNMDKVDYKNYLPIIERDDDNDLTIYRGKTSKTIIPTVTHDYIRYFYKIVQNAEGIITDIFSTYMLSFSKKKTLKFKTFFFADISLNTDPEYGAPYDYVDLKDLGRATQKLERFDPYNIVDDDIFEDGTENNILNYLKGNIQISEIKEENMYDD